jgi:chromosome segregation ATPase
MDASSLFGVPGLSLQALGIWLFGPIGVGAFVAKVWNERRSDRKLSIEDREAKRAGFQGQVDELWSENRHLRLDLERIMNECEARLDRTEQRLRMAHTENDHLREELMKTRDDMLGFKRQLAQIGDSARHLAEDRGGLQMPNVIVLPPKE